MVNLNKLLISLVLPISVTLIIPLSIIIFIERKSFWDLCSDDIYLFILGILFLLSGLVLLSRCILIFFKFGKGTLMPLSQLETQRLVIIGPYRFIRNPMILGVILILLGESFIFGSWWILGFTIGFFILNLIYIPLFEEKGLERRFGQEFLLYKSKVYGWIPYKKSDDNNFLKLINDNET